MGAADNVNANGFALDSDLVLTHPAGLGISNGEISLVLEGNV